MTVKLPHSKPITAPLLGKQTVQAAENAADLHAFQARVKEPQLTYEQLLEAIQARRPSKQQS